MFSAPVGGYCQYDVMEELLAFNYLEEWHTNSSCPATKFWSIGNSLMISEHMIFLTLQIVPNAATLQNAVASYLSSEATSFSDHEKFGRCTTVIERRDRS